MLAAISAWKWKTNSPKESLILPKPGHQNLLVHHGQLAGEPAIAIPDGLFLGSLGTATGVAAAVGNALRLHCQVPIPCLGGEPYAQQAWFVDGASDTGTSMVQDERGVTIAHTDDFVFATITSDQGALELQSRLVYEALLSRLRQLNKPHLLRLWNYVPRINEFDGGIERYQLFNVGRRQAFDSMGYSVGDGAPAACALGTRGAALIVAALASKHPVIAIENPRQVSAYHYPRQYGSHPPIFSRAAWLAQKPGPDLLFVSGTASIVGHRTLHAGNVRAQVQESVTNIEAVLHGANQRAGARLWTLGGLQGRVYIRHAADFPLIKAYLQTRDMTQFGFVQADICRSDLLLEIEAEGQTFCAHQ